MFAMIKQVIVSGGGEKYQKIIKNAENVSQFHASYEGALY